MAPSAPPEDITRLLQAHHGGDRDAFNRLVPAVYERLRTIAHGQLARGRRGDTLDTTALVHEAYVQLIDATQVPWQNRSHFFAICARVMRRIIVDFCRRRHAQKRGGKLADVTLEPGLIPVEDQVDLVLAVDQALERLSTFNERLARLVECRYFGGMSEEETAAALEVSVRTVERDWVRARAWLQKELG